MNDKNENVHNLKDFSKNTKGQMGHTWKFQEEERRKKESYPCN